MQPSIGEAQPLILDGGITPGCLPPARGAARELIIHTAPEGLLARATVSNGGYPDYTQCGILHLDAEVAVCI